MNAPTPPWSMPAACNASVRWLEQRLARAGLRAIRTFDLHDARLALVDCTCPHHGTAACDCQMVVLLVYAPGGAPVSLVIHGNDGQSWISLVDRPDQPADPGLMLAIKRALQAEAASET